MWSNDSAVVEKLHEEIIQQCQNYGKKWFSNLKKRYEEMIQDAK